MVKTFFSSLLIIFVTIFVAPAFAALPAGYTELEYIESTGTQYIDTGYKPNQDTKVEAKVIGTENNGFVFGSRNGTRGNDQRRFALYFAPKWNPQFANYNYSSGSIDIFVGTVYDIEMSKTGLISNGVANYTFYDSDTFSGAFNMFIFGANDAGTPKLGKSKIYYFKIYNGDTLVRNLVPAKNSSGVVGMYDTVSGTFFTNAGTGTFTAGPEVLNPCRNLFDSSAFNTDVGQTNTWLHFQVPNGTYTMSTNFPPQTGQVYTNVWVLAGNVTSGIDSATNGVSLGHPKTITVTDGWYTVVYRSGIPNIPRNPKDYNWQFEQGSTATAYVPYNASCHNTNGIKIATTAYNTARFSQVKTDLNSTIATIREIVTKTINQTAAIASLQADKQTRPEDACPAGKKCLLVETEENGVIVPHWFPIIENIYGLPAGYTALEYIQSDGASYLIVPYRVNNKTVFYCRYNEIQKGPQTGSAVFGVTNEPDGSKANYGILRLLDGIITVNRMGWGDSTSGSIINVDAPENLDTWYEVLYDQNKLYQNGRFYEASATQPSTSWTANYDLGIFARNGSSVTMPAVAKISSVWAKENGEYKINLVPAKRNSDNVVGMYDTVNDRFYTNAGTGTFTAGPEI